MAGARAGLAGERSGLFRHQIRIIKEMRDADKRLGRTGVAVRPRFAEKYGREHPAEPDPQIPAPENTETQALHRIELAEVLEAFQSLGPDMRQVVSLRAMEGLPYKEIGEIMGKSENWARVTYFRAKEILAREAHHEDF